MKEIWKKVPNWEEFCEVSNTGRFKYLSRTWIGGQGAIINHSEILTFGILNNGYYGVKLTKNGKTIRKLIHKIVGEAFIPNPENKKHVNHKNGIKTDNRVENLEWATKKEDAQHAWKTGLKKASKGEKHGMSKITESQVLRIRKLRPTHTLKELSKMFEINIPTIGKICNKQLWKHI